MKYLIKESIQKNGQTQGCCCLFFVVVFLYKKETKMILLITGVFLSYMLLGIYLILLLNVNDGIGEQQAGFRKDYSTVDQFAVISLTFVKATASAPPPPPPAPRTTEPCYISVMYK